MTGQGPLGTSTNNPEVDAGTTARTQNKPPGPVSGSQTSTASPIEIPRLMIHLDLKELIEIDDPREGRTRDPNTGTKMPVLFKGKVIKKDPNRPQAVLALVRKKFQALQDLVQIELGTGTGSDRFLKARFGYPLAPAGGQQITHKVHGPLFDPAYVGAGADALSRTRLKKFKPIKGDAKKGVTAYIFEGAIGHVILDFFPNKGVNINNIFATAIAHELGHNLGLSHVSSPRDIMFVYAMRPEKEQRQWMTLAEKDALVFSSAQLSAMRKLLQLPSGTQP